MLAPMIPCMLCKFNLPTKEINQFQEKALERPGTIFKLNTIAGRYCIVIGGYII